MGRQCIRTIHYRIDIEVLFKCIWLNIGQVQCDAFKESRITLGLML